LHARRRIGSLIGNLILLTGAAGRLWGWGEGVFSISSFVLFPPSKAITDTSILQNRGLETAPGLDDRIVSLWLGLSSAGISEIK
jgi:hypothetical protein